MREQQIAQALRELEAPTLYHLRDLIDVLLAEVEETTTADLQDRELGGEATGKRSAKGWVELKMINGYGPYAYRRWREGGVKRSEYIGKVRDGT